MQTQAPTVLSDDRTLAILTPVSAIFFGFLGPLVVWLVKKGDGDTFVVRTAREALNFQITIALAFFVSFMLMIVLIGMLLLPLVTMLHLVLCVVGAVKASNGEEYRYPFIFRWVKS